MSIIHNTAIIEPGAQIASNVTIGPFCYVGKDVKLASGVELKSHVVIENNTSIGENTVIHPFAVVGGKSQDIKYKGGESYLKIGSNCIIREHVTINPGNTKEANFETTIGNNCMIMIGCHIAHDCKIEDNVIMANNTVLAGHVIIKHNARIGGMTAVRQFVRIGEYAMIGGMSGIENDIIPYGIAYGERASLQGLNLIGLKRNNFDKDLINNLRHSYKILFENNDEDENEDGNDLKFNEKLNKVLEKFPNDINVINMVEFIKQGGNLAICRPKVKL